MDNSRRPDQRPCGKRGCPLYVPKQHKCTNIQIELGGEVFFFFHLKRTSVFSDP